MHGALVVADEQASATPVAASMRLTGAGEVTRTAGIIAPTASQCAALRKRASRARIGPAGCLLRHASATRALSGRLLARKYAQRS